MKAPLKPGVLAGRFVTGSGALVVVGFFLPMVRGCGAEVSAFKATQVNPLFWLYISAGVVVVICGLVLFRTARRGLLVAASAVAAVPFTHLLFKSWRELTKGGELDPLVGYWMLLFSLGFATIYPWFALRGLARATARGTATGGGGRVAFEVDEEEGD
ncbi:MAG: hypothetical protein ABIO70_19295 [Pseudomonadota bacterium]